jgi:hypothetical protein
MYIREFKSRNTKVNSNPNNSVTQKLHNFLIIFHQNVCGSRYKTDELYSSLYPDFLHVLCITEHYLNYAQLFGIGIDNYKLWTSYCRMNSIKGGACSYVHENINSTQVDIKKYCLDYDIEARVLKVHLDNTTIHILTI